MTIALSCYVLLPTGLALRPYRVYGSDIFARLVRMLYAVDSSKNVCPSIHVLNTVTLMIGYRRSRCIDVVLGAALAFALDAAASSLERSGEMRRIPQRL